MSDLMSSEDFRDFFKQPCINRTRATTGKTEAQFEEKLGISLDSFLDGILQEIYDLAADQNPEEVITEGEESNCR